MDRSPLTVLIWLVAAGLVVLVGMRLLGSGGESAGGSPVRIDPGGTVAATPSDPGSPARARVIVHVAGAVRAPGLYRVATDARVATAVERAGGPTGRADLAAVNLAARVQDGQQIVVPARGTAAAAAGTEAKPSLGSATAEQLEELDGIGPALAERIVEFRAERGGLRSIDDLAAVEGIGEQRLASLKEALQP